MPRALERIWVLVFGICFLWAGGRRLGDAHSEHLHIKGLL